MTMDRVDAALLPSAEPFDNSQLVAGPGFLGFSAAAWGDVRRVIVPASRPRPALDVCGAILECDPALEVNAGPVWRRTDEKREIAPGEPIGAAWRSPVSSNVCIVAAFDNAGAAPALGAAPSASLDIDGETWIGEAWLEITPFPSDVTSELTIRRCGTLQNNTYPRRAEVSWLWPRWVRSDEHSERSPYGFYAPAGQDAVPLSLGAEVYSGGGTLWRKVGAGPDASYVAEDGRTLAMRASRGGPVWAVGTPDAPDSTWYEAEDPPTPSDGGKFPQWRRVGQDIPVPTGQNLYLTFRYWGAPLVRSQCYVAEIPSWL